MYPYPKSDEAVNKKKVPSARTSFLNKLLPGINNKMQDADTRTEDPEEAIPFLVRFYDPVTKARDPYGRTLDDMLAWPHLQLEYCHNYIQMLFPLPEGSPYNITAPIIDREVFDAFRTRPELRGRLRESFLKMLDFYGFEVLEDEADEPDEEEEVVRDEKNSSLAQGEDRHEQVTSEVAQEAKPEEAAESFKEDAGAHEHASPTAVRSGAHISPQATKQGLEEDLHQPSVPLAQTSHEQQGPSLFDTAQPSAPHIPSEQSTELLIVRAPHWREMFRYWAVSFDHNHLRISRILRSLRVLGLQQECEAFYKALKEVSGDPRIRINERSRAYWRHAVRYPLHVAPDGGRVLWLRRWEEEEKAREAESESREATDAGAAGKDSAPEEGQR